MLTGYLRVLSVEMGVVVVPLLCFRLTLTSVKMQSAAKPAVALSLSF